MADLPQAPDGASALPSPEVAARWPAAEEWPTASWSSADVARFYTHRLGLRALPTPSPADRHGHALYVFDEAVRDYRWAHAQQDPPDDLRAQMWDDARAFADAVRGPIPKLVKARRDRDCTEDDVQRMWCVDPRRPRETAHHPERGVCILLGVGRWWVPAQVDVDPRARGDLAGYYANLPGPRVATPRGGVHVFVDARGTLVHSSDKVLAPGVEVRTQGFALLPSGAVTPDRTWVYQDAPRPPPRSLLTAPPRPPKRAAAVLDGDAAPAADPWAQDGAPGRVASLIAMQMGQNDGRTSVLRAVVGMLAQARGVPSDVCDALLAMLTEYGVGMDWPAARVAEEVAAWRLRLTRGPRDADFAVDVATMWEATRDSGPVRKGEAWARNTARSLWKTADRRQEGTAGAEDLGHAGQVGDHDRDPWADDPPRHARDFAVPAPSPPHVTATTPAARSDLTAEHPLPTLQALSTADAAASAVQTLAAEVSAGDADAQRAKINEFKLRKILPTIGQAYPLESMRRDVASTPVKVECLYPFFDFVTGKPEVAHDVLGPTEYHVQVGHGYGRDLSAAVGGIREGDFKAFGAAGAKGGKTHFLGQMVEGLALCTAARILGVSGYANCPIVMPVWVSEMPKEGEVLLRMMARLYGFDSAAIADGTAAAEARGIVHMSAMLNNAWTPAQVVQVAVRTCEVESQNERSPVGFAMQRVVREIDLGELPNPKGTGRQRVDYRSGPNLIGFIADATAIYRRELADLAGVSEDKVLPLVLLDPGQRFAGDSENSKAELDALLGAVVARICRRRSGLGGACIMTSDTTKAAARDLDLECFLSEPSGQKLAADIFAGSQAIMHHCDVFAVCGDDSAGDHFRRTQWVRVLQGRTGASAECFPFSWETHTGRFRPRKAEPLRKPDPERGGKWGGGGGGRSRQRRPAMFGGSSPPEVGDHTPGANQVTYRPNAVRPRHEPRDD